MPTFKLNGQEIPFEEGDTVIRAAWRQGIEIPHYCWHPGLPVDGNCRMCLVHIESGRQMAMPILKFDSKKQEYVPDTKAKLQIACQFPASEGLEVSSVNAEVKEAQRAVQEYLLLNHPVDCPICDQSGECKLQDYYYAHQFALKRKKTEIVHKPKGVRFGPTIVYDAERCIMCTRCIRVCDELAHDHVLDKRERGNHDEIVLAPGRELDHKYTLMTELVCPVGALTSRDFRFKARVWFLKRAPGVCSGCATGCNTHIDYDPRYGKVYRLYPRDNPDVNKFWMCDDGMMTYHHQQENRVLAPTMGRGVERVAIGREDAIALAAGRLAEVPVDKLAIVLSAQHSSEDNLALAELGRKLGVERFYLAALGGWEGDDTLRHPDNNPNRAGAVRAAGGPLERTVRDLVDDVQRGEVRGVLALGWASAAALEELAPLTELSAFVSLTTHVGALPTAAAVVLPVTDSFEMHGTFVNAKGLAQTFKRAIPAPPGVEPAWKTLVELGAAMGQKLPYDTLQDVRAAIDAQTKGVTAAAGAAEAPA